MKKFFVILALLCVSCSSVKVFNAIRVADFDTVKTAVEQESFPVDFPQVDGTTALLIASEKCSTQICEYLISKGANVNAKNDAGDTPLLNAMRMKCFETAVFLESKGADVKSELPDGKTCLYYAVEWGSPTMTAFFVEKGCDVNKKTKRLKTPLMAAAELKSTEILKYLMTKGALVNEQSAEGFTPLIIAVTQGNVEMTQALLAAGADVEKRCFFGRAIDYATVSFRFDLQQILREAELKQKESAKIPDIQTSPNIELTKPE